MVGENGRGRSVRQSVRQSVGQSDRQTGHHIRPTQTKGLAYHHGCIIACESARLAHPPTHRVEAEDVDDAVLLEAHRHERAREEQRLRVWIWVGVCLSISSDCGV